MLTRNEIIKQLLASKNNLPPDAFSSCYCVLQTFENVPTMLLFYNDSIVLNYDIRGEHYKVIFSFDHKVALLKCAKLGNEFIFPRVDFQKAYKLLQQFFEPDTSYGQYIKTNTNTGDSDHKNTDDFLAGGSLMNQEIKKSYLHQFSLIKDKICPKAYNACLTLISIIKREPTSVTFDSGVIAFQYRCHTAAIDCIYQVNIKADTGKVTVFRNINGSIDPLLTDSEIVIATGLISPQLNFMENNDQLKQQSTDKESSDRLERLFNPKFIPPQEQSSSESSYSPSTGENEDTSSAEALLSAIFGSEKNGNNEKCEPNKSGRTVRVTVTYTCDLNEDFVSATDTAKQICERLPKTLDSNLQFSEINLSVIK